MVIRLYTGLIACNHVMERSIHVLSHLKDPGFQLPLELEADGGGDGMTSDVFYEPTFSSDHHHSLLEHNVLILDKELSDRLVTVYNADAHTRSQLVTIYVSTYYVKVRRGRRLQVLGQILNFRYFA